MSDFSEMSQLTVFDDTDAAVSIRIEQSFPTHVEVSERVLETAAMFGLGVDEGRTMTVVPETELCLRAGQVVFVTGPSGGGKSTILRLIAQALPGALSFGEFLQSDDQRPLVDQVGGTLEEATHVLALAGLADAFVMLRRSCELSDGQRYRFALARLIDQARRQDNRGLLVTLADEFGSTLDRLTASVVARNVRQWVSRVNVCFVCATTHDDLLESLEPDVLVYQPVGEVVEVQERAGSREPGGAS